MYLFIYYSVKFIQIHCCHGFKLGLKKKY